MDDIDVAPVDTLVEPRKFVCPDGFEKAVLEGLCIEDLEDDDNELWLIEVPVETDVLDFHGQEIELSGTTKVELCNENYEFCATENISNEMAEFQLVVPRSSKNKLRAVSKPFQGHIKITKSFNVPEPGFVLQSPVKGFQMPDGLKQRYKAFGCDEPFEALEEPRKHKPKKKKKKYRSEREANDVPELIKIEENMDSDGDISKISSIDELYEAREEPRKHKLKKKKKNDRSDCETNDVPVLIKIEDEMASGGDISKTSYTDEPHEACEEPRKHKLKKKRKNHRSDCETNDVPVLIKIEDEMASDGDISKISLEKKKKHRSHKSNDSDILTHAQKCDFDENQNSILMSVECQGNNASSSALHSKKAKKKKKKVKTEEMSE